MKNILFFFTLCGILLACSKPAPTSPASAEIDENIVNLTEIQLKNAHLSIAKAEKRKTKNALIVNGVVASPIQQKQAISVPLGGYLRQTKLVVGMAVKKGDVIAVVEDQQYLQLQQDYLMTQSKIKFGQLELDRQKILNQNKAGSDKLLQQAEEELANLRISSQGLIEKMRFSGINLSDINAENISPKINIRAPMNGYVNAVHGVIGKYVSPTEVLFEVINTSELELNLKVFEKDAHKIMVGQSVLAYTNESPTSKQAFEITFIRKELNADRSVDVICKPKSNSGSFLAGNFINAEIQVATNEATMVPSTAIVRFDGKQFVFVQKSAYVFEMVEIKAGNTEGDYVEIMGNQDFSQTDLVLNGAYNLLSHLKNKE